MQTPSKPADETARIALLRSLDILDSEPEERFDRLTRIARRLFDVPIALVSLVDEHRQWFKSCNGLSVSETPRDISFCGHAILGDDVFLIPDATQDKRFSDNPLVVADPKIRFYAGCPLVVGGSRKLGTLCLIDRKPRDLDADDLALLRDLARMAEQELEALQLATLDELTKVSNRRGFEALAEHAMSMCRRKGESATLMFFDLDRFKPVNDRYGHAEGDRVLCCFADLLRQEFRESDVVGRVGGDEFAVFATGATDAQVEQALDRFRAAVSAFNDNAHRGYNIEFSVGSVNYDTSRHASIADLIREADALMYEQKQRARDAQGRPSGDSAS